MAISWPAILAAMGIAASFISEGCKDDGSAPPEAAAAMPMMAAFY
jgi:hypothetical protein